MKADCLAAGQSAVPVFERPTALALRGSHRRLIRLLGQRLSISRTLLAHEADLPATTVSRLTRELIEAELVEEVTANTRAGSRSPGRPSVRLRLVGPAGRLVLVAQSHYEVRVATADFHGQVGGVATSTIPLRAGPEDGAATTVADRWARLLSRSLETEELTWRDTAGVVVGVPKPNRRTLGQVGMTQVGMTQVGMAQVGMAQVAGVAAGPRFPVLDLCLSSHGIGENRQPPVLFENDANLGALGEAIFGSGQGGTAVIYVKIVNDIGAGIISGGQIFRGAHGIAGELVHVPVEDGGPCPCGSPSCLAAVLGPLSQRYLTRAYCGGTTLSEAALQALRGEQRAQDALVGIGRVLGRALSGLCTMIDPDRIVLDGALGAASRYVISGVKEMLELYSPMVMAEGIKIVAGGLEKDAELYGGIALFRQAYVDTLCAWDHC